MEQVQGQLGPGGRTPSLGRVLRFLRRVGPNAQVLVAVCAAMALINIAGLAYYAAPIGVRVRSDLHDWLKPTGYIGQSLGIVAFLGFLFLWLYPLRKRLRPLSRLGSLPAWLDVHIVVGLTVPLIGATHAAWRFRGLIGLGYLAMFAVACSGIVGKYLYLRIPRARDGAELTRDQIERERGVLIATIASATDVPAERIVEAVRAETPSSGGGVWSRMRLLLLGDLTRGRRAGRLARKLGILESQPSFVRVLSLLRKEMRLEQQVVALEATRRLFRFWHIAHMPVAITALIAVTMHVVLAVVLGVTWF